VEQHVIQQTPSEQWGQFAMGKKLRRDPVSIRAARPVSFARRKKLHASTPWGSAISAA
jgi:hypothetical protein